MSAIWWSLIYVELSYYIDVEEQFQVLKQSSHNQKGYSIEQHSVHISFIVFDLFHDQALTMSAIKTHHWQIQACSAVTGEKLLGGINWMTSDISSRILTMDWATFGSECPQSLFSNNKFHCIVAMLWTLVHSIFHVFVSSHTFQVNCTEWIRVKWWQSFEIYELSVYLLVSPIFSTHFWNHLLSKWWQPCRDKNNP